MDSIETQQGNIMAIFYNVQIHPVYAGHINDYKVLNEREFDSFQEAINYMEEFNEFRPYNEVAAYPFAIDTETGEEVHWDHWRRSNRLHSID